MRTARAITASLYVALAALATAQTYYTVTNLGTLGGTFSSATAVNDLGQVVVNSYIAGNAYEDGFLYSNGQMTDLGALGTNGSSAAGINDSGTIVGTTSTMTGRYEAFVYQNGTMTDLGVLPGGAGSGAAAINNAGVIVGSSSMYVAGNGTQAYGFVYQNGSMTALGHLSGATMSYATAISSTGQVVGYGDTAAGQYHPIVFSGSNAVDLGVVTNGYSAQAFGVNAAGTVIGWGNMTNSNSGAFAAPNLANPVLIDPTYKLIEAFGINSQGQVVGFGTGGAYLGTTNLNTLTLNLTAAGFSYLYEANAISDTGYIVGEGITLNGQDAAFLLTPVPEPSVWLLLLSGVGCLAAAVSLRGRRPRTA